MRFKSTVLGYVQALSVVRGDQEWSNDWFTGSFSSIAPSRLKPHCSLARLGFAMRFKTAALVPGTKISSITSMPVNEDKKSQRHLELAT